MKIIPLKVIKMTLFLYAFVILFSCSKDSELLLDSVLNEPEIALEENEKVSEDGFVTRTFTFSPINDAYVQNEQGYDQSLIRLEENNRTSYLMFDLSEVNGTITNAVLQFSVDSDEGDGSIAVHKGNSTDWSEENLTSTNAPSVEIQLGSINKAYTVGAPEKVVLNASNINAEATTLVMTHSTGNDLAFASKEHPGNKGPKLEITYTALAGSPEITPQENEGTSQGDNTTQNENTTQGGTTTQEENTSQNENTTNNTTASTEGAYYVTTNGSPSNNGLSEATAWSIEHALSTAVAGNIVYVKAGNYGNKELIADNSGTQNAPIKFIGYTNSPGDLVSNQGSTFKYGESLDSNKMPLLIGSQEGTGILIHENYVEFENFQITKFRVGVFATGLNVVLRNIIITEQGSQSNYNAYDGFGFQIKGNNSLLENCFALNMTAEAFRLFDSDYSRVNYCSVFADNPSNPTDYYFILTGGTNNSIVENSYAERMPGLRHGGHGFDLKDLAENNIIRNCTARRTNFELNFSGVKNNTISDSFIYGVDTSSANWHAGIVVANGANNNLIKNIHVEDTWAAIRWIDDDDGYIGPGGDRDLVSMGYENTYEGISVRNTNRILNVGSGTYIGAKSDKNIFKNCSFTDFDSVSISYFKSENNLFENCEFTNGNKLIVEVESYSSFTASWSNCSWANVNFSPPN